MFWLGRIRILGAGGSFKQWTPSETSDLEGADLRSPGRGPGPDSDLLPRGRFRRAAGSFERAWTSNRGEFHELYGRRRVGKSRLLAHFVDQDRRHLIYEATSGSPADNLEHISRQIAAFTGRSLYTEQPLTNWRARSCGSGSALSDPMKTV